MTQILLIRLALLSIAAFGTFAGMRLSVSHLKHGEICPVLGPVPACFIVLLGYLCVLIVAIIPQKMWSKQIFYLGWSPVFLLATYGVIFEIIQGQICPPGPASIPQCFFSLAMAVICWVSFRQIDKHFLLHINK